MTTEPRTIADIRQAHSQFPPGITPELFAAMFDEFRVNREHLDSIWHDLLRDHPASRSSSTAAARSSSNPDFRGLEALGLRSGARACLRIVPKDGSGSAMRFSGHVHEPTIEPRRAQRRPGLARYLRHVRQQVRHVPAPDRHRSSATTLHPQRSSCSTTVLDCVCAPSGAWIDDRPRRDAASSLRIVSRLSGIARACGAGPTWQLPSSPARSSSLHPVRVMLVQAIPRRPALA